MELLHLSEKYMESLMALQTAYKQEIGEEAPTARDRESLQRAIEEGRIFFYGCVEQGRLIACCSITPTFSTFNYQRGGVFEDFYVIPAHRHTGVARKLVQYAYGESGVGSLIVGCADCDVALYRALGFTLRLGNMLAFA